MVKGAASAAPFYVWGYKKSLIFLLFPYSYQLCIDEVNNYGKQQINRGSVLIFRRWVRIQHAICFCIRELYVAGVWIAYILAWWLPFSY